MTWGNWGNRAEDAPPRWTRARWEDNREDRALKLSKLRKREPEDQKNAIWQKELRLPLDLIMKMVKCNRWKTSTMLNPASRVQMDNIPYTNSIFLQIKNIMHSKLHATKCSMYQFEILKISWTFVRKWPIIKKGSKWTVKVDSPWRLTRTFQITETGQSYIITSLPLKRRKDKDSVCFCSVSRENKYA